MRPSRTVLNAMQKAPSVVQGLDYSTLPPKSTVFSMVQPTGVFHLGNYMGAVRPWVDIANAAPQDTRVIYGVADLHSITVPKDDPKQLRQWRHEAIASILASGVDAERCLVYYQSQVPQHAQLNWVLSTITSMGYLNRMTQWKSKANLSDSSSLENMDAKLLTKLHLGLFSYPVLQAADVLIHKAHYVPVGEDQGQHLELTRQITKSFNARYGQVFPVPSTLFAPFRKVSSLRDPAKKMSKSDPDQNSCIYLTDEPGVIRKKLRKAVTDSIQGPITYDPQARRGVASLLEIVAGLVNSTPQQLLENELAHVKDHKMLKDSVAEIVIQQLEPVRARYKKLTADPGYLQSVAQRGAETAQISAQKTIDEVYNAIGF